MVRKLDEIDELYERVKRLENFCYRGRSVKGGERDERKFN